jgi:hypothetical protein
MVQVNQTMDSKSERCRELTSLYPIPLPMTRPPSDLHAKVVSNPELSGDALDLSASSGATSAKFSLWIVLRNGNPPRPECTSYEMGRMVGIIYNKEGRQHRGDKQLRRHPRNGMVGLLGSLAELSA